MTAQKTGNDGFAQGTPGPAFKFQQDSRLMLWVGALIYLGFYPTMNWVAPNDSDSWLQRVLVSLPMIAIAELSQKSGVIQRHQSILHTMSFTWMSIHYYYLTWQSGFEQHWFIGVFLTLSAVAACMLTYPALLFFCFVSFATTVLFSLLAQDGKAVLFSISFSATVLIASFLAFSAKLRLLRELEQTSERFLSLFNACFDGMILHDHEGVILDVNTPLAKLLDVPRREILGKPISTFLKLGSSATVDQPPGHPKDYIQVRDIRRRDSSALTVELATKAHRHDNEEILFTTVRDITEKVQTQKLLAEQQAQMVAASKMSAVGQMASGVAHEINNPLAIIQGLSRKLTELQNRGQLSPDEILGSLDKITLTVMRIARIVKSLQAIGRDVTDTPPQVASLKSIVDDTLELCREKFRRSDVEFALDSIPESVLIECRPTEISQVILNLLNNALDAVEGTQEKWVRLKYVQPEAADGKITLAFEDSGPGIPAELREKVLQPFFTTKPMGKGTGLGLSISKGLIEQHAGALWLDFDSKHTRFIVELPQFYDQQ